MIVTKKNLNVLRTKQINVGLFDLNESYGLGKKITVLNRSFTVSDVILMRQMHWIVFLK
ncbi:hypothetical protein HWX41_27320 [Bacillus paramycoides]|uniref:hypothetical protein n=1 Tax=Bacillus paramycoides TaxID=2026194 RepID=UPI0015B9704B|nr:hypothetical protein [Bacillus paramycoides]NWK72634.1 hypothetical protein [Bacillus paramycoides]